MRVQKASIREESFREDLKWLPYNLKRDTFRSALTEIYELLYDLESAAVAKGWDRLEDILPKQTLSGMLSALLTATLAKHSRSLVINTNPNGHPDLLLRGEYENNCAQSATKGVEIKATNKRGGAVDMHSDRTGWTCVFVYSVENNLNKAIINRAPLVFEEVYLGNAAEEDFRLNPRGARGTRTATIGGAGLDRYRSHWVYLSERAREQQWFRRWQNHHLVNQYDVEMSG